MGGANSISQLETQLAGVKHEIKPKKIRKLHQQILYEYPFLANVFESVLICDNRLPDCPIVFCNDLFEQMTLYPKEEIIGKNCRFLQGPDTNQHIVKVIRRAVDQGLELDVEILNYRKDGVPFYNNFLMLPVHQTKKHDGSVTHFIAIQKDITVLRQPGSTPANWTAPEVAMWLHHIGLQKYVTKFIDEKIDGKKLFEISKETLTKFNFAIMEKRTLLTKIHELNDNPAASFCVPEKTIEKCDYKAPGIEETAADTPVALLGGKVDVQEPRRWWRNVISISRTNSERGVQQEVGKKKREERLSAPIGLNTSMFNDIPENKLAVANPMITVKMLYNDAIKVSHYPRSISFDDLISAIQSLFHIPVKAKYRDIEGDWLVLDDDESLQAAIACTKGGTLNLRLTKKFRPLSEAKMMYLQALPLGVIIIDSEATIIMLNNFARELLNVTPQEYMRKPLDTIVSGINLTLSSEAQSVKVNDSVFNFTVAADPVESNQVIIVSR